MSVKLMAVVWDLDLPPGEKLVLLALADQANDEGRQCWPSVDTIKKRSGQGERTVRRALASLEEKGFLTRIHREGTSTQYHVHPCQIGTPAETAPLPKTTKTPAKLAPKTPRTTKTKHTEPRGRLIPDDWRPADFSSGSKSAAIVAAWDREYLETTVEHFIAHHQAKRTTASDWQPWWKTWVLNSKKFGVKNDRQARLEPPRRDEIQNPYARAVAARQAARAGDEWGQPGSWSECG